MYFFKYLCCCKMLLLTNPYIWLRRIRHRKGYGVHSPFAYDFIRQVLEEHDAYYAYSVIDSRLKWWQRFRYRRHQHLLFRLHNFWTADKDEILVKPAKDAGQVQMHEGLMLVLTDIHRYREEWKQVKGNPQVTVTFDLYDIGIAFCLARLNKQDYTVNW